MRALAWAGIVGLVAFMIWYTVFEIRWQLAMRQRRRDLRKLLEELEEVKNVSRVRITGYYDPEPDEADDANPTGLTEEAYTLLISDEESTGLKIADLDDVEVERA